MDQTPPPRPGDQSGVKVMFGVRVCRVDDVAMMNIVGAKWGCSCGDAASSEDWAEEDRWGEPFPLFKKELRRFGLCG